MFSLLKGDCEHCGHIYRYSLLSADFGDCSYAYCDTCGKLATLSYASSFILNMPPAVAPHHVIDAAWESFIRPCDCGGAFRHDASPRCLACARPLSARHAAGHIEHNFAGGVRNWRWQRNWAGGYCINLEDPAKPGVMRHLTDPFLAPNARSAAADTASRDQLTSIFKSGR
ncbi:MAG TPA: hypothetical protein VE291_12025 [Terracidiphilus sp.]|nr:hypothetical protein [Terracidiphilus sp.]